MFILNKYGDKGKNLIAERLHTFQSVIKKLEDIYDVRPFNQQTVQSLTELYLLVSALQPRTILELGAGTRSSTLALATATATLSRECTIYSLDVSPIPFQAFRTTHFPGLTCGQVIDIQQNAVNFLIPTKWKRPLFMLYDAHDGDIPGSIISSHAINHWFPELKGQVVAMHDCSVFSADYGGSFADHYTEAVHFSGRKVVGFPELKALVGWMNDGHVDLCRPGDELQKLGFEGHDSSLIYFVVP